MGVVYRAKDPMLNREVAVKLIPSLEVTPEIADRFQREAQIVAQMDHPGIVPIYDLGKDEGSLFFVMPVVEGENLRHLLWGGTLHLGEVLDIGIQRRQRAPGKRLRRAGQVADALRRHRASLHSDEFSRSVVLTASRVIQRPAPSAFIGREKEFAELQHRLNAAISGDCQFAVVAGEPGIGKTRLLEELKKLASVRKIRALYGRFVEQDRAFSYQGFSELIQDYFRTRDAGSSVAERPDFADLAPDLLSLFPLLTEIPELRA